MKILNMSNENSYSENDYYGEITDIINKYIHKIKKDIFKDWKISISVCRTPEQLEQWGEDIISPIRIPGQTCGKIVLDPIQESIRNNIKVRSFYIKDIIVKDNFIISEENGDENILIELNKHLKEYLGSMIIFNNYK